MARPLRTEYPGAYYHVMNLGRGREDIFLADKDRLVFLDGLSDGFETNRIKLIVSVERIIGEVVKAGNAQVDVLRDRKTKFKDLRQMAMKLSYSYSNCNQKEIGIIYGVDYSTVSQSRTRLKAKMKSIRKLKKQFEEFLNRERINLRSVANITDAFRLLAENKTDAIVYDKAMLRYMIKKSYPNKFEVLGFTFESQQYGFAIKEACRN